MRSGRSLPDHRLALQNQGVHADLELVERRRLRALVDGDIETAAALHHDDFLLVTPGAASLTKSDYLDMIESGTLKYLVWEPGTIVVRMLGDAACLRYAATLHARYDGQDSSVGRYWHTDYYERHNGVWQVVFSHATGPTRA